MSTSSMKIHPLLATAAGAVIVFSLVGTAALLDWLPGSHGDADRPVEAKLIPPVDKHAGAASDSALAKAPARISERREAASPTAQDRQATAPRAAPPAPMQAPTAVAATSRAGAMPPPDAAPVCASCGKVLSVRTVDVESKPSGVGVVAGAVVGGLLGNQVGGGSGRTLATVAGAVGGGYAGNEIEKRTRKAAAYEVEVQFEDGSRNAFIYETAPPWKTGDRVRLLDGMLAAR